MKNWAKILSSVQFSSHLISQTSSTHSQEHFKDYEICAKLITQRRRCKRFILSPRKQVNGNKIDFFRCKTNKDFTKKSETIFNIFFHFFSSHSQCVKSWLPQYLMFLCSYIFLFHLKLSLNQAQNSFLL